MSDKKVPKLPKQVPLVSPFVDWCIGVIAGVTFGLAAGITGHIPNSAAPVTVFNEPKQKSMSSNFYNLAKDAVEKQLTTATKKTD